ncbi:MAG: group III truncated hemoglobin [Sphingomonadaceae bacterium]
MSKLTLDEAGLSRLVDAFYARVRADAALGPIFNGAIDDWPRHLDQLAAFWSSVMLTSGRYKGQPVPAHLKHREALSPAMFDHWLALWGEVTAELMQPAAAAQLQAKAARIAESLQLAIRFRAEANPALQSTLNV